MRLAIFDIDGTLVRGSSERLFWRYLAARGRQGPRQIFAYLLFLVRYLPTGGIHWLKKNKAYLCGLASADVAALADEFVETRLLQRLYTPVLQRLRRHLQRGDAVVFLTGTLDPIAQALARRLGVRHVCATLCRERNGIYLAEPPEIHPFGFAKIGLAEQLSSRIGGDIRNATAYGDSHHDRLLLEAVHEAIAVLPDRGLQKAVQRHDWETIGATGGATDGRSPTGFQFDAGRFQRAADRQRQHGPVGQLHDATQVECHRTEIDRPVSGEVD
jgi:HAD superfamily hydrolase (TIGR01490 family)